MKNKTLLSKQCPECNFVQTVIFCKCKSSIHWDPKDGWVCQDCNKKYSGNKRKTRCHFCGKKWKWEISRSQYPNIGMRYV